MERLGLVDVEVSAYLFAAPFAAALRLALRPTGWPGPRRADSRTGSA